jgi:hypothetical protein
MGTAKVKTHTRLIHLKHRLNRIITPDEKNEQDIHRLLQTIATLIQENFLDKRTSITPNARTSDEKLMSREVAQMRLTQTVVFWGLEYGQQPPGPQSEHSLNRTSETLFEEQTRSFLCSQYNIIFSDRLYKHHNNLYSQNHNPLFSNSCTSLLINPRNHHINSLCHSTRNR